VSDFKWDESTDEYRCPADRPLQRNLRNFKVPRTGMGKRGQALHLTLFSFALTARLTVA
jgi:hypothetical protein